MLSNIAAVVVDVFTNEAEVRNDAVDFVVALEAATLTHIAATSADWTSDTGSSCAMPDAIENVDGLGLGLPMRRATISSWPTTERE